MPVCKFIKTPDQRWYIDLPSWQGSQADLEMVAGADTLCEFMADGEDVLHAHVSADKPYADMDELTFLSLATDVDNGAYYHLKKCRGIQKDLTLWICDVTLFVLGEFPKTIYICKL